MPFSADLAATMTGWRRHMHQHPELAFAETHTAAFVAARLREAGLGPVEGVGGTGVVAVIDSGRPGLSIGLRADIDALPMADEGGKAWQSTAPGTAHACGHDGHTAALLGVAQHLAQHPPASGRVVLIFQPAEENGLGAQAMLNDGLLQRFPFDEVYAFHNMPLLAQGTAGVRVGPALNGFRLWEVQIAGVGGHGAAFFRATDPVQAAARLTVEIASIVGRYIDPGESGLISVCSLQAGSSHNIIPEAARLSGTLRAVNPQVIDTIWQRLQAMCDGVAAMTGCTITLHDLADVPPCVNDATAVGHARAACAAVLGEGQVVDHAPFPFTDDFAHFLAAVPGAYLFIGHDSVMCHNPAFDFDDTLLPVAAGIFTALVRQRLG